MTPPEKKPRVDAVVKAIKLEDPLLGHIRETLPKGFDKKISDNGRLVAGIPWRLFVSKTVKDGENFLWLSLQSWINPSKIWSITINAVFIVVNVDKTKNLMKKITGEFHSEQANQGVYMTTFDEIMDESKGFLKSNTIDVEVHFKITKTAGLRIEPTIDNTDQAEPLNDVTFLINGQKIMANRGFLAVHSPVFNIMLNRDFAEKHMQEIPLEDIDEEEFLIMLGVLYPSRKKISDGNVRIVLKIADRFQIRYLIDQAEEYLMNSSGMKRESKLLLSDKYRLAKLQGKCIEEYKVERDIVKLKASREYKDLSDAMKVLLFEKVFAPK